MMIGLAACGGSDGSDDVTAPAAQTFSQSCSALLGMGVEGGTVKTANYVSATPGEITAASFPNHCLVRGSINDRIGVDGKPYAIQFEVRLPSTWNRRFFFQGGSGVDGTLFTATGAYAGGGNTRNALLDGSAVVTTDSGHLASSNTGANASFLFAVDPQARLEYGYAQLPLVANAAKAVIAKLYGSAPAKSYFVGTSNGGRMAMMAAQRFPQLFDGIIAMAPGFRLAEAALEGSIFRAQIAAAVAPLGSDGLPDIYNPLTTAEKATMKAKILAACDALDGALDGMVSKISACAPDPLQWVCTTTGQTDCLTSAKANYIKQFFAGAKTLDGKQIYAPWPYDPGMVDLVGTPAAFYTTIFAGEASHVYTSPPTVTTDLTGYARTANLDTEFAKISATSGIYTVSGRSFTNAESADMDAFRAKGGKILYINGTADWAFSATDLENYYKQLQSRYGAPDTATFARMFKVPGMDHGSGGKEGTDQFDSFGALVRWVEDGVAPDSMTSTARLAAGVTWPGRTRPLCAYPKEAIYNGTGSIELAASFHCE